MSSVLKVKYQNDLVSKMTEIYDNIKNTVINRDDMVKKIVDGIKDSFIHFYEDDIEEVRKFVKNKYVNLNIRLSLLEPHEKETINAEFDKNDVFLDCIKEMESDETFKVKINTFRDLNLRAEIKRILVAFGFNDSLAKALVEDNEKNENTERISKIKNILSDLMDDESYNYLEEKKIFIAPLYESMVDMFMRNKDNILINKSLPLTFDKFKDLINRKNKD